MKILYYSAHPGLKMNAATGYGTHMREMIEAFKRKGHEVLPVILGDIKRNIEVVPESNKLFLKKAIKKIIPNYLWKSLKDYELIKFDLNAELILEEKIIAFNPDLIYERGSYLQLSGVKMAKKFKLKHYIELNAPFVEESASFEGAAGFFKQKALHIEKEQILQSEKTIVVSSALQNYYSDKYKVHKSNFLVTPNCINAQGVLSNIELKQELITRYHLKDKKIIGFVGSIFPYHGVDLLIEAFSELQPLYAHLQLLIVGDGAMLPKLKAYAFSMGTNAIFTGSVSHKEIYTYIDIMDIAVMAKSNWYGSPVKIFEYGAMGKTIIAPDTKPVRDVMEDGVDGFLVKPAVKDLKNAISKIMEDAELGIKMGENFKNKVFANYTWDAIAAKILNE